MRDIGDIGPTGPEATTQMAELLRLSAQTLRFIAESQVAETRALVCAAADDADRAAEKLERIQRIAEDWSSGCAISLRSGSDGLLRH